MTKFYVTDGFLRLRHVGILELGAFYTWLQRWFDYEFAWKNTFEKSYDEIILPDGNSKNIEIKWKLKRNISSYFDRIIEIEFTLITVSDTEIQQGDVMRKVQKGDFEIRVAAYVETNPEKVGKRDSMFRKVLEKFFLRRRIEEQKNELREKISKFNGEVREIFKQYEEE